jgi:hypothetical protein
MTGVPPPARILRPEKSPAHVPTTLSPLRKQKSDCWLVLVLVIVGFAAYLPRLAAVVLIDHDDVISVIGATCNQGRYEESIPTGRWVDASVWQQYWQWQGFGCFAQIGQDLAQYDIHPPLYFWLLHTWFGAFGVSVTGGLVLNLLFLAVGVISIYSVCRVLSVSRAVSFIATLAWMLSLPTRTAVSVLRPYALFAALTALLLLLVVLWVKRQQGRYVVGIGVVLAAGLLTHYQFAIPAGLMLAFALRVVVRRRRYSSSVQLVSAVTAAVLVFFLVHPGFLASVLLADSQGQSFTFASFGERMVSALATVFQMFNPLDWSEPLPFGLFDWQHPLDAVLNALNVLVGCAAVYFVGRLAVRAFTQRPRPLTAMLSVEYLPAFTAVATWCLVVAMYVLCISPVHAIGLQYLHFITPSVFVAVAQLAQAYRSDIPYKLAVSIVPVLLVGAVIGTSVFVWHRSEQQQIFAIRQADAVVIDTTEIGILPAVLWHVDPDTPVYAAGQTELVARLPGLVAAGDSLFYVASSAYSNSDRNRDAIVNRLTNAGYRKKSTVPQGDVYLIPLGGDIWVFDRSKQ